MKIIVDNGGTKSNWMVVETGTFFSGPGVNLFDSDDQIISHIRSTVPEEIMHSKDLSIDLYTAGYTDLNVKKIHRIFNTHFAHIHINLFSDLLAASRALFQHQKGIACILGTGSNCAYYDGVNNHLVRPSLGYLFGDEGSGYYLGKKLLTTYFRNELSNSLASKLEHETSLKKENLLSHIYSLLNQKSYIASLAIFLKKNEFDSQINEIIRSSLEAFLEQYPFQYPNFQSYKFGFVGSVAFNFKNHLNQIMEEKGLKYSIIDKPIVNLLRYYQT